MNQATKSIFLGSVMAASLLTAGVAMAESPLTANVGVTSNYIWRGMTQTNDQAAVSGGIDYAHKSGAYAGTWASNALGEYELDLYAGYGFDAGPVGLDLGLISYQYPVSESNFSELYANANWQWLSGSLAYTLGSDDNDSPENSSGDIYLSVGAEFEVKQDLNLGLTLGSYSFSDSAGDDFSHFQVSLSKSDFTFALDKNNRQGVNEDAMRVSVSWSKGFDL